MARATHATISSNRVAHFENVGKQALEQSGKYRVNKNDEEVDGGSAGLKFGAFVPLATERGLALRSPSWRAQAKQSRDLLPEEPGLLRRLRSSR